MSNKISYILEVLDGYSAITKDLKKELSEIQKLTKFKFNSSDFKGLAEFAKQADKIATSAERLKKAKTGFTLIGESFSSSKINAAALRANRAYEKSLKNAIVPFNNPFIMMSGGRSGGYYNPKAYKPNFNIPINSTYRRDAAGTGIVPYSRGGAVMPYGQRPMIDVTGTGRTINQESTASWQSEQRYNPKQKAEFSRRGGDTSSDNSRSSGGVSFKNVAKGMGYYRAIDMAAGLPSQIIDTRRQFDSLNATLQTVLPSYDKTTSSSQLAANEMEYLIKVVRTLGLDLNATKEEYVKFLAASAGKKSLPQARKEFESFAKLSTVYGIDPYRFKLVMSAITQTTSKGILNLEELQRQLGDSLPGAVKLFADSLGLTEPVFRKLVSDGKITSDVLANVSTYIDNNAQITSGLDIAMQKLGARLNRVSTSWTLLVESLSQGEAGTMINDWVTILDNGIQKLTKSLEIMGAVWNSSPIKGVRKLYDVAEVGAEIYGQGYAAIGYDIINGGNEGRAQFRENLRTGNIESYQKNFPEEYKENFPEEYKKKFSQFTPIPTIPISRQEVVVRIIGENLPSGLSIKQEPISIKQESKHYSIIDPRPRQEPISIKIDPRPKTVIAGGL